MGSSRGSLQLACLGGFLSCAHVLHLIALATSTSRTDMLCWQTNILSSLWSVERSACGDSAVGITWQHLCESLERVKVETLAKSMLFPYQGHGIPLPFDIFS